MFDKSFGYRRLKNRNTKREEKDAAHRRNLHYMMNLQKAAREAAAAKAAAAKEAGEGEGEEEEEEESEEDEEMTEDSDTQVEVTSKFALIEEVLGELRQYSDGSGKRLALPLLE